MRRQLSKVKDLSAVELQLPVSTQPGISGPTRQGLQTIEDCRTKLSFIPDCLERYQEAFYNLRAEIFGDLKKLCDEYALYCRREMNRVRQVKAQDAWSINADPSKIDQMVEGGAASCREAAWLRFFESQSFDSNTVVRSLVLNILDGIARFRAGARHP